MAATNVSLMKKSNRLQILRLVRTGEVSRAELSRQTGLTRAAITMLVDELIGEGLLLEGEVAKTAKGRHPVLLKLNPHACHVVGIDLSREGTTLCFLDFTMQKVFEKHWPREIAAEQVLNEITQTVKEAAATHRFLGAGVCAPGPIDVRQGKILTPTGMQIWHGFEVCELERRLEMPVLLEKDTNALAIAEKTRMSECGKQSFLVLLADHGLGAGFVYQGRLFSSQDGYGGEIGHTCLDMNGPRCSCGNQGCAELYASVPVVVEQARKYKKDVTFGEVAALAQQGEQPYRTIIERQVLALSTACVSAVNMLEPECIVLQGELSVACPYLAEELQVQLRERCFSQSGKRVSVVASGLPSGARAVAAGALVLENYLNGGYDDDRFGSM